MAGYLARMLDERLHKRVLFGQMDGSRVRGRSQKNGWIVSGKDLSLLMHESNHTVDKISRQGRLEGCHRIFAAALNAPDLRIGERVMR